MKKINNFTQKIVLALMLVLCFTIAIPSSLAFAEPTNTSGAEKGIEESDEQKSERAKYEKQQATKKAEEEAKAKKDKENYGEDTAILTGVKSVEDLLNLALSILTVGVGVAATGSLIFAGFLYMTAGSNAGQVVKAKTMIFNTVIGILAYAFMWAFLNWLIPGGVF